MKRLRCKLGWHEWEEVGWLNLSLSDRLKHCVRCGAGLATFSYGQAYIKYTPEQMRMLAETGK